MATKKKKTTASSKSKGRTVKGYISALPAGKAKIASGARIGSTRFGRDFLVVLASAVDLVNRENRDSDAFTSTRSLLELGRDRKTVAETRRRSCISRALRSPSRAPRKPFPVRHDSQAASR